MGCLGSDSRNGGGQVGLDGLEKGDGVRHSRLVVAAIVVDPQHVVVLGLADPVTLGGPLVILYGSDLTNVLGRVEAAGGKIVKPIFEFPGGRRFHFTDPDGYELAVWSES